MIDTRLPLTDIHRHLDGNIRLIFTATSTETFVPKPFSILVASSI